MEREKIYWLGAHHCDVCRKMNPPELYNCRTNLGVWGMLCKECFNILGVGLGIGKGQRYERQEDGKYLQVEGGSANLSGTNNSNEPIEGD